MFKKLFFKYENYKLEKFQIENLSTSIVPFLFYSLDPLPEGKDLLIKSVQYIKNPIEELEAKLISKDSPIVFVCKKSKKSKKFVRLAVEKGFKNVYFVDGGLLSLLK